MWAISFFKTLVRVCQLTRFHMSAISSHQIRIRVPRIQTLYLHDRQCNFTNNNSLTNSYFSCKI